MAGELVQIGAVTAAGMAGTAYPEPAVEARGAPPASDSAAARQPAAAGKDVVELSTRAKVDDQVKLVGRARQPELQLSPERLRAMMSRDS